MENITKEVAALLRSTDDMAVQFLQRVQTRVGEPVPNAEILAAMQKISPRSLSMDKVVAKLQQRRKSGNRQASRHRTAYPSSRTSIKLESTINHTAAAPISTAPRREPRSILESLESVLDGNWDRAEAEGLRPNRMSAEAFVNAIHQHTDRREGTRQRILQAARQLDENDVMLTPTLVADVVHKLYAN